MCHVIIQLIYYFLNFNFDVIYKYNYIFKGSKVEIQVKII